MTDMRLRAVSILCLGIVALLVLSGEWWVALLALPGALVLGLLWVFVGRAAR